MIYCFNKLLFLFYIYACNLPGIALFTLYVTIWNYKTTVTYIILKNIYFFCSALIVFKTFV